MEENEALKLLKSGSAVDRLRGARALRHLDASCRQRELRSLLDQETDAWVRLALSAVVEPVSTVHTKRSSWESGPQDAALFAGDIRAQTTRELIAMVVHELDPLVGTLRLASQRDSRSSDKSAMSQAISRIQSFLNALQALYRAYALPTVTDFSLSDLVVETIASVLDERRERSAKPISISPARSDPIAASGDCDLLRLALVNILRNALEATELAKASRTQPVVVNWGCTDRDAWIAVFDRGVGLPGGSFRMGQPGVSTKDKSLHRGMGLAVSHRALQSMNGLLSHRPREGGGVVTEMRWPTEDIDADSPS